MQEKIPDIVVPSLEGFQVGTVAFVPDIGRYSSFLSLCLLPPLSPFATQLKPYVSHKTPYVSGKVITAEDILEITGHHHQES